MNVPNVDKFDSSFQEDLDSHKKKHFSTTLGSATGHKLYRHTFTQQALSILDINQLYIQCFISS